MPDGLRRLAHEDPLLEPWCQRLAPDLERGLTLGDTLRRHRVLQEREGRHLDQHRDPATVLIQLADGIFHQPWIVTVACWLPSVVAVGVGLALVGSHALFGGISLLLAQDLGLPTGDLASTATWTATGALAVVLAQVVLREVRGLRWIDLLLFPSLQRALALADLHALAPLQSPVSGWRSWWAATGMGATRRGAPPWDRP